MRCEDFPCCGHELGCCPDFDSETGQQVNMKCTCGATLPINNRYSICGSCMKRLSQEDGDYDYMDDQDWHD